jgi:putative ABC transport system permease protein
VRWAWRLFRREWRQQVLVLAMLTVAVAATTAGTALATNAPPPPETTITLPGSDPQLLADVAALQQRFPDAEVVQHEAVPIPGSIATVDVRAQELSGGPGHATERLLEGRYPSGPNEVALTDGVAHTFGVRVGGTWTAGGRTRQVVGLVESPQDLNDQFALLASGQIGTPSSVTVQLDTDAQVGGLDLPSGTPVMIESRSAANDAAAVAVLALATIGLVFVGLVAVAGFTVMAQRRQRALGMLGAVGATDRHVRLVMLANGFVVGAVGAVIGAAVGLAGWIAFAPRLESVTAHRIDRFDLPWWAIVTAMILALVTAVAAAAWPARAAARVPVVAALSGRPPRPQPAHRFAALGAVLLPVGVGLLAFAHQRRAPYIVAGTVATALGVLLLAPLAIQGLAAICRRAPIAIRLAMRDLARYQARSSAALGAVALAVGIAATVAVSAAAARTSTSGDTPDNLPANELIVYLSPQGADGPIQPQTPAQLGIAESNVGAIAKALGSASPVALDVAVDPNALGGAGKGQLPPVILGQVTTVPGGERIMEASRLYVATPALLAHYGISVDAVDPGADVLTSRTDAAGLQIVSGPRRDPIRPKFQSVHLPRDTSDPNTVITTHAVQTLGLQVLPAGWLITADRPLSHAQVDVARRLAASAGLTIETRSTRHSATQLGHDITAGGIILALGVLAMTVGLIRSETANDLRVLTATGASSNARRTITAATAGALALLGALLGTAGAYIALLAWHHSNLHALSQPPIVDLIVIVVGLPFIATGAGWLLAGREPPAIARRPLD